MWLGLIYIPSPDDEVILCAWRPGRDRPFALAGARGSVAEMAAVRAANRDGAFVAPRCDACRATVDLLEL